MKNYHRCRGTEVTGSARSFHVASSTAPPTLATHNKRLKSRGLWGSCDSRIGGCILIVFLLVYISISQFLNIPYWVQHGYAWHRDHFKLYTSLDGQYCGYQPNEKLQRISHDNTDFEQTRSRVLLLSYPRSGNHLTRSMIECLLETATFGYEKEKHNVNIRRETDDQQTAIHAATVAKPFVRKIHKPIHIPPEFAEFDQFGLIFLIRDPIECVISENRHVPYFWKDYEWQFEQDFLPNAVFYDEWSDDSSKLLLYYEDYFREDTKTLNLEKLADFFGEQRVSKERRSFCETHLDDVMTAGLGSLQRESTATDHLHYYRHHYLGEDRNKWPMVRVNTKVYDSVFNRYDDIVRCDS